jgi:hypothetical protein
VGFLEILCQYSVACIYMRKHWRMFWLTKVVEECLEDYLFEKSKTL